jgi:hypothetical protein
MATSKRKHRAQERPVSEGATLASEQTRQVPLRVRLPGFVRDEDIGLGDVVKRATYSLGIRPCGGCGRRAAALNRWVAFTR